MLVRALPVVLIAAAALCTYARGVGAAHGRGVPWPARREAAFAVGVLLATGAVAAPVPDRTSGRVVEHLVLGIVAPALLALGRPVSLARHHRGGTAAAATRVQRVLLGSRLSHPLLAAAAFSLGPWLLWLTPVYGLERQSALVHQVVHLYLLGSGGLFAVAVLGLERTRWGPAHGLRLLAASALLPVHTLLGLVLVGTASPWLRQVLGVAGTDDRHLGAGLVWVAGAVLATGTLGLIGAQWARAERRPARASPALPRGWLHAATGSGAG